MISKTSVQTIRALLELAHLPAGKTQGVGSIAKKIRVQQNYLGKVLQRLVKEGILISQKGLNGGFRLAKTPAHISLYDIVSSLENVKRWEGCFMGEPVCLDSSACCMHRRWDLVRRTYVDFLKSTTIADLKNK
ncbi:MAG: Rrf2 family transcriptional regulator [Candidatus Omnitrophica bacterium]|nr:Rrf2 family transcriptional regulator [Candidatus Omnitrophota bacterium]